MPNTYRCPKCARPIGTFDGDVLKIDGMYVKELHAVCCGCGYEFHYTLSGRRFERLVEVWQDRLKSVTSDLP